MKKALNELDYNKKARDEVLQAAIAWLDKHPEVKRSPKILLVNMNEPSYRKRAHLYDFETGQFLRDHHTTHGDKSCLWYDKANATKFSNEPNSHMTSLGMMRAGETYYGKNGKSRRLNGLEKGINDNVAKRSVVLHQANYVTDAYIMQMGMAGCSWGCFAFAPRVFSSLVDDVEAGTLVYCYHS